MCNTILAMLAIALLSISALGQSVTDQQQPSLVKKPQQDEPLLLVHKTFGTQFVVMNRPLQVTVNVYNIGSRPALHVKSIDTTFKESTPAFELLSGSYEHQWASVPPKSNVSYSFQVLAQSGEGFGDRFFDLPVKVSYSLQPAVGQEHDEEGHQLPQESEEEDSKDGDSKNKKVIERSVLSSSHLLVRLLTEQEYSDKYADHQFNWIIYAALNAFFIGGPYLLYSKAERKLRQSHHH